MSSIQYTIRAVPESVDKALRKDAQKNGKSLNQVIVEALEKATGTSATVQRFNDLDHLFGVGIKDKKAFDEAMEWQDNLPMDWDFKI